VKKIIRFSTLILILSGFSLTSFLFRGSDLLTGIHILLGFIYLVLFLLFSIDHVAMHKNSLTQLNAKNIAGMVQIGTGALVLLSGFIIYLFGSDPITPWTEIHLGTTLVYLGSTGTHFLLK